MSRQPSPFSNQRKLNHVAPATREVGLGDICNDLITAVNAAEADATSRAAVITAVIADIGSVYTGYAALLADVTALRTAFNTAMTKLNADAGVTDTNYAADGALTAAALTAATATVVAAATAVSVTTLENR